LKFLSPSYRSPLPSPLARNSAPEGREGGCHPCRTRQTDNMPCASSFFRYPPVGGGVRHSDHSRTVGASGRKYHHDLHTRPQPRRKMCQESLRPPLTGISGQQKPVINLLRAASIGAKRKPFVQPLKRGIGMRSSPPNSIPLQSHLARILLFAKDNLERGKCISSWIGRVYCMISSYY
jgi:hypothetical protein